ncbi:SRPBCC domain-containing protein [Paenibacillus sp. FJAT-26967]|uniref:SRPBCC family protein n=1 Tax=Paenibacillus sp. FJAT-26967 TaxID=1729690 RepID=UPI000A750A6F|nr:SRPBCC domain-containing protein [Paenibacillus sp. FJAT-26967]
MTTTVPEFTISLTLNARRELVWRAWTEEKELAAWLPSTPLESISFDVREGGCYRYTMVNNETGQEYHTGGVFLDVIPYERLGFTWVTPMLPLRALLS